MVKSHKKQEYPDLVGKCRIFFAYFPTTGVCSGLTCSLVPFTPLWFTFQQISQKATLPSLPLFSFSSFTWKYIRVDHREKCCLQRFQYRSPYNLFRHARQAYKHSLTIPVKGRQRGDIQDGFNRQPNPSYKWQQVFDINPQVSNARFPR